MKRRLLIQAQTHSMKFAARHPERNNFLHFSYIVQEKAILGWGFNHAASPPVHFGYGRDGDKSFAPKSHAEVGAYKQSRGLLLKGEAFSMINIRLNRSGTVKLAKPCDCCYNLLSCLGCSAFWYSTNDGFQLLRGGI